MHRGGYGPTRARIRHRPNKSRLHVQDELQQLRDHYYVELEKVLLRLKILTFHRE